MSDWKSRAIVENSWKSRAEPVQKDIVPESKGIGSKLLDYTETALPMAGAMAGGLIGAGETVATGGLGIAGAPLLAAGGGAVGTAARDVLHGIREQGLDYFTKKPTIEGTKEASLGLLQGGIQGAEQEMGGQIAGKVLRTGLDALKTGKKAASDAISAASERLGFKPTPGMISDSPTVQGLESTLEQSPTIAGRSVRETTTPVREGLKNAMEDVLKGQSFDKQQAGEAVAKGLASNVGQDITEAGLRYEPFNKELPKMIPNLESRFKLADQVAKSGQGSLSLSHDLEGFAKNVSNKVMDSNSLDDIESIRKQVSGALSSAYRSGDRNSIDVLSKIQDHLADFRDDQFVGLAKEGGNKELGSKMVEEYQQARTHYKNLMTKMSELGQQLGIKAKTPSNFVDALSNIPDQKLTDKLFNVKKEGAIEAFKESFPEQFETLRQAKLSEFKQKYDGSPQKFVNAVEKLSSKAKEIIFGPNVTKIDDMKLVMESMPDLIGPSGTPKGMAFQQTFSPFKNAEGLLNQAVYKAGYNPTIQNAISNTSGLLSMPGGNQAVGAVVQKPVRNTLNFTKDVGAGLLGPFYR